MKIITTRESNWSQVFGIFKKDPLRFFLLFFIVTSGTSGDNHSKQHVKSGEEFFVDAKRRSCSDVNKKFMLHNKTAILNCSCIYSPDTCEDNPHKNFVPNNLDIIFYEIYSTNLTEPMFLQLHRENGFLAPSFQVEERFGDLYVTSSVDEHLRECFYDGRIVNDDTSTVTINICNGLVSFFSLPDWYETYFTAVGCRTYCDNVGIAFK